MKCEWRFWRQRQKNREATSSTSCPIIYITISTITSILLSTPCIWLCNLFCSAERRFSVQEKIRQTALKVHEGESLNPDLQILSSAWGGLYEGCKSDLLYDTCIVVGILGKQMADCKHYPGNWNISLTWIYIPEHFFAKSKAMRWAAMRIMGLTGDGTLLGAADPDLDAAMLIKS